MKHIVQYSGGVGSAMAAYLVSQQQPKEDIILLFHDVRGGMTKIYTDLTTMLVNF
jgi:tRNA U34 2-thiouridine synthase MnmA/TrmU